MKLTEGSWRAFLVRTIVFCGVMSLGVFVAVRAATAREGVAGGNTRDKLSFAGTLTGNGVVPGSMVTLTFRFHRPGMGMPICEVPMRDVPVGANNAVAVEVPIDPEADGGARCPTTLFDGSDVQFDVLVGATEVAMNQAINPVPYARYADRVGTPDCPTGYERDGAASTGITVCFRVLMMGGRTYRDEVVRVGSGSTAFWIDRYESSAIDRDARSYGGMGDPSWEPLLRSGRWFSSTVTRPPVLALSLRLATPARYVTWFQANELCRTSGKRLPNGSEWLAAAQGTPDMGVNDAPIMGMSPPCNTASSQIREAGRGTACVSAWGAQDMIGNLAEWTDEWYPGVGVVLPSTITIGGAAVTGIPVNGEREPWGTAMDGYGDGHDGTANISSAVERSPVAVTGDRADGMPAAAQRGGSLARGARTGVFNLDLGYGPTFRAGDVGFRCVIPR